MSATRPRSQNRFDRRLMMSVFPESRPRPVRVSELRRPCRVIGSTPHFIGQVCPVYVLRHLSACFVSTRSRLARRDCRTSRWVRSRN